MALSEQIRKLLEEESLSWNLEISMSLPGRQSRDRQADGNYLSEGMEA